MDANLNVHYNDSELKVFDVLGNEVATLGNEYKPAGNYEVEFNAKIIYPAEFIFIHSLPKIIQKQNQWYS